MQPSSGGILWTEFVFVKDREGRSKFSKKLVYMIRKLEGLLKDDPKAFLSLLVNLMPKLKIQESRDLPPSMCPHPELGCGC